MTVSGTGDENGDSERPRPIAGSSDSTFRGDAARWNPAQLLVAALAGLHRDAHERCFIANSVNFPVRHEPIVQAASAADR